MFGGICGVTAGSGGREASGISWVEAAAKLTHRSQGSLSPWSLIRPQVSMMLRPRTSGSGGDIKPNRPLSASAEVRWGCECSDETNRCGSGAIRGVQVPEGESI